MNKIFALFAALGLMAVVPFNSAKALDMLDEGQYVAFDIGFGSIEHDVGDLAPSGSNIGFNIAAGMRGPFEFMETHLFWGAEVGFGFSTLDEDESSTWTEIAAVAATVADDGAAAAVTGNEVTMTQTINAEESWNLSLSGDIGYAVTAEVIVFGRLSYVYAGGADATYSQSVIADDTSGTGGTSLSAADLTAVANAAYRLEAAKTTGRDANYVSNSVSEASSSFAIGVGGEYDLIDVMPGLSARGLVMYNIGDRSGVDLKVGVGWKF